MDEGHNRRDCTRVQVTLLTELRMGGEALIVGTLSNVSLSGLFIQCDTKLPVGTPCEASLVLEGGLGQVYILARVTVTRTDPSGMALQFIGIHGHESYSHLQNLVLYNSRDSLDKVEQEILMRTYLRRHPQEK